MLSFIGWLIVGVIAGFIARALVPGRDPMGFLGTMLLGLVGSVLGGLVAGALIEGDQDFEPASLIGSIVGAIVVLLVYRAVAARRGDRPALR
jgi:uncharacterized membrane protein YeaQ/YmgE (transglycosylase-associated protein family)